MKQFFILMIFAVLIALGMTLYYIWPEIEPEISQIYNESPEPDYFEEEEEVEEVDPETSFEFEEETTPDNLIALAKTTIHENPHKSWDYLEQALEKDPSNPHIRIYRARMLEGAGKPSLAEEEYILAYAENPEDLPFTDQYISFLMRRGNYTEAQTLLNQHLTPPSTDSIWLKAWFLGKVYKPIRFQWEHHRIPTGNSKPLVKYVLHIPQDRFWDEKDYKRVAYRHEYLERQQTTYWLRVLDALKTHQYDTALQLLEKRPFQNQSWNPQLEVNLARIINYRLNRTLSLDEKTPTFARLMKSALTHQLSELAEEEEMNPQSKVPNNIRSLLLSDEIFSIALLDSKWNEAAIALHQLERYPANFPKQYAYDFALALSENRGKLAALNFAEKQESTPEMALLIAEIRLEMGDDNLVMNQLHHLSREPGEVGLKASRLIAQTYMQQNEYQKAKEFIERTPHLQKAVSGQELLAQIFREQNQPELAYRIYLAIEGESTIAKSYLAHKALKEGDWERAKELTEKLIVEFPDNKVYRRNLEIIRKEH